MASEHPDIDAEPAVPDVDTVRNVLAIAQQTIPGNAEKARQTVRAWDESGALWTALAEPRISVVRIAEAMSIQGVNVSHVMLVDYFRSDQKTYQKYSSVMRTRKMILEQEILVLSDQVEVITTESGAFSTDAQRYKIAIDARHKLIEQIRRDLPDDEQVTAPPLIVIDEIEGTITQRLKEILAPDQIDSRPELYDQIINHSQVNFEDEDEREGENLPREFGQTVTEIDQPAQVVAVQTDPSSVSVSDLESLSFLSADNLSRKRRRHARDLAFQRYEQTPTHEIIAQDQPLMDQVRQAETMADRFGIPTTDRALTPHIPDISETDAFGLPMAGPGYSKSREDYQASIADEIQRMPQEKPVLDESALDVPYSDDPDESFEAALARFKKTGERY